MVSHFLEASAPHRMVSRMPATNPSFMRSGIPSRKKKLRVMERDMRILVALETRLSVEDVRYHRS